MRNPFDSIIMKKSAHIVSYCHLLLFLIPLFLLGSLAAANADDRGINKRVKPVQQQDVEYDSGKLHAFIVGIDRYENLNDLKTAVKDAKAVATVLRNKYGFNHIKLLLNEDATRTGILRGIREFRNSLSDQDSLLIYYAGHGRLDNDDASRGYWVPSDGNADDIFNDIANEELKDVYLSQMKVRHLFLLSDSCFSGSLHRGIPGGDYKEQNLFKAFKKPSRWVLSSGDLELVPDDSGNGHSPFCNRVLQFLNSEEKPFAVEDLHHFLRRNLGTEPVLGSLKTAAHQPGGSFVFMQKNTSFSGLEYLTNAFNSQAAALSQTPTAQQPIASTGSLSAGSQLQTNAFIISNPVGGELVLGGVSYSLAESPVVELGYGVYPFTLRVSGSRKTIYGKFEVLLVDEETTISMFGGDDILFKKSHINAVLKGSPVRYRIGITSNGQQKVVAKYLLSLRKIY